MHFLARAIFARHKSKVARYLANILKSLWVIDSNNECERCERPDADDLIQAVGDRVGGGDLFELVIENCDDLIERAQLRDQGKHRKTDALIDLKSVDLFDELSHIARRHTDTA